MRFLNDNNKILSDMKVLNPNDDSISLTKKFTTTRRIYTLLTLCAVLVILILSQLLNKKDIDESLIKRSDYTEGSSSYSKEFTAYDGAMRYEGNLDIDVERIQYSDEEARNLLREAQIRLIKDILGKNKSLKEVRYPLNLITGYEDKLVDISWTSSNYDILENDGRLYNENIGDEGIPVSLNYEMSCEGQKCNGDISVVVYPPIYTDEELINLSIQREVMNKEKNTRNQRDFHLPTNVDNIRVSWGKKSEYNYNLIIFAVLLPFISYRIYKDKLNRELKYRKSQLVRDYWDFTDKLILYMLVGMNIRTAISKISEDYLSKRKNNNIKKHYIYEELVLTLREISNGVPELTAYENCGKRCGLVQYRKLFGYLIQGVKNGSKGTIEKIQEDVYDAFDDRKNLAIRMGEEATSKLLIPMLMMLGIVIVVVVLPAFLSFGSL